MYYLMIGKKGVNHDLRSPVEVCVQGACAYHASRASA